MNGTFKDVEIFTEAPLGCHRGGKERNDIKCEIYIYKVPPLHSTRGLRRVGFWKKEDVTYGDVHYCVIGELREF